MPPSKKIQNQREKLREFQIRLSEFLTAFEKLQRRRSPEREEAFADAYNRIRILLRSDDETRQAIELAISVGASALRKSVSDSGVVSFSKEVLERELRAMMRSNQFKKREIAREIEDLEMTGLAVENNLTLSEIIEFLEEIKASALAKVDPSEEDAVQAGKKNRRTLKKAVKKRIGEAGWLICKGILFISINWLEDSSTLPTDFLAELIEDSDEIADLLQGAIDEGSDAVDLLSKVSYLRGTKNIHAGIKKLRNAA